MSFTHPDGSTVGPTGTGMGGRARGGGPSPSAVLPALTILYHPDFRRIGDRLFLNEIALGGETLVSRNSPEFFRPDRLTGDPLANRHLSRRPIVFRAQGDGGVEVSVGESQTTLIADGKTVHEPAAFSAAEVDRGVVLEVADTVVLLLHRLALPPGSPPPRYGLVGDHPSLVAVREDVRRVADLEVPVLLRGETGTGKELVARAIHDVGPRRSARFVDVNLGAIPASLSSAHLFGAVKGAYTDSVNQEGFFRRAHGGTLFLDEIGEAPEEVQVKLLRVLESGEIYPVGSASQQRVDVRVIAATDSDLEAKVQAGKFRAPLLHRLAAGFEIRMPPLRERRDDVGRLLLHFLRHELARIDDEKRLDPTDPSFDAHWLPPSLVARLARYDWPGNVRQLHNVVRQLVIGSRGMARLDGARLERLLDPALVSTGSGAQIVAGPPAARPARRKPSEVSEDEILEALCASRWDIKAAAERLRISRPSLYTLMESSPRIRKVSELEPEEIARCYRECQGDLDAMAGKLKVSKRSLRRRVRELKLD